MNIINALMSRDTSTLSSPKEWLSALFSSESYSGVNVTTKRAMEHTAVYDCVNIVSESIASLPISVYKTEIRSSKTFNKKDTQHQLYHILHDEPNPDMTSFSFFQLLMVHLLLRGNFYAQIVRNNAGVITGIYPLDNEKMKVVRLDSGRIGYIYTSSYGEVGLDASEVLHYIGMSLNGIVGISAIAYNRHTIGASIAMETFGSTLFKNGANPSGVVSGKEVTKMSDTAFKRFKESFKEAYQGLMNAGKPLILEDGYTFTPITISNKDGQFIESRKFTKAEIASIFRVPPHMINELDKATFSNIEQQSIDFVTNAIRPWCIRIEQETKRKCFTATEKKSYYVKFNMGALLRGDTLTRYQAYESAITKACWMNRNEARELEDLNPVDGLDDMLVPLNFGKDKQNATN
ncbi:phage portal protein [Sulfurimonas sp. HSL-1716]|uniref:phage portal protein n=1 Tax=Hydrocurvibacter sulfurireducens TaxID=3131937 RepID=UPI0031FA2030